jgi:hypothetical protein
MVRAQAGTRPRRSALPTPARAEPHGARARRSVVRCRYLPARPAGVLASFTAASVAHRASSRLTTSRRSLATDTGIFCSPVAYRWPWRAERPSHRPARPLREAELSDSVAELLRGHGWRERVRRSVIKAISGAYGPLLREAELGDPILGGDHRVCMATKARSDAPASTAISRQLHHASGHDLKFLSDRSFQRDLTPSLRRPGASAVWG